MEQEHCVPEDATVVQTAAQQTEQVAEKEEPAPTQTKVEDEEFPKQRQDETDKTFKDIVQQLRAELDDTTEKLGKLQNQQRETDAARVRQSEEITQLKQQLEGSQQQTVMLQA